MNIKIYLKFLVFSSIAIFSSFRPAVEEAAEKRKDRESNKAELATTIAPEEPNATESISNNNAKEVNNEAEPLLSSVADPLQPLSATNNLQELRNHLENDLSAAFSTSENNDEDKPNDAEANAGPEKNEGENKSRLDDEHRRPQSARGVHRKKSTSKLICY